MIIGSEEYNKKSREFTKFVKTATLEEIAERIKNNDDDRLIASYTIKKLKCITKNTGREGEGLFTGLNIL